MQTHSLRSGLVTFTLAFALGVIQAHAGNMQEALDELERAKHSEKEWHLERALGHLENAKRHLEDSGSSAPERREAIRVIREAVDAAQNREWRRLNERIDRAIQLVREGTSPAPVPVRKGNMQEALEFLESAKHSEREWHLERAIEKLEAAKHHLEVSRSPAPERVEAIHQIREAIAAARDQEWRRLNDRIDRAIRLVREGIRE